mmetsp:Transcript_59072/g.103382  ORF Transcript_59072/g.103382 Transcript_59072/m.103382 type:complete len:356 (+) Transcript_59072:65-1132(+)
MTRITKSMLFALALFVTAATSEIHDFCEAGSCELDSAGKGRSLLTLRTATRYLPTDTLTINMLPDRLKTVGISLFGDEAKVIQVLANTKVVPITYSAIVMRMAMAKDDDAAERFGANGENGTDYGLDSLLEPTDETEKAFEKRRSEGTRMLNMIDMGGNLGVTTIAVFKKYPGMVRGVVVEPVPTTHFYLQLNLWLNDVPPLATGTPVPQTGVSAIQKAISSDANFKLEMCIPSIGSSMNAFIVTDQKPCQTVEKGGRDIASSVTSMPIDSLFDTFGGEDVTFVKMDCETCEKDALPAMEKFKSRVRRLGGEMHMMPPDIYKFACAYNQGMYLTGMCERAGTTRYDGKELCGHCS